MKAMVEQDLGIREASVVMVSQERDMRFTSCSPSIRSSHLKHLVNTLSGTDECRETLEKWILF